MPIDLQNELLNLRRSILRMGAAVEQRVRWSIESLNDRDAELARRVRVSDTEIDDMEVDIEEECLRILALLQPMATDLRFILAVMRMNTDLERIGDLARSIAKRVIDLDRQFDLVYPDCVAEMGSATIRMLDDALTAFSDENMALAKFIRQADQRVDDLQKEVFSWVQREIQSDVETTQAAIDILSVARKLERIADHATNIAEDVMFLIEGSIVRHSKA